MFWILNPSEPGCHPATTQDRRKFALGKPSRVARAGSGAGHATSVPAIYQVAAASAHSASWIFNDDGRARALCRRYHGSNRSLWDSRFVRTDPPDSGAAYVWNLYYGTVRDIMPVLSTPNFRGWLLALDFVASSGGGSLGTYWWRMEFLDAPDMDPFRALHSNRFVLSYKWTVGQVVGAYEDPHSNSLGLPAYMNVQPWYA